MSAYEQTMYLVGGWVVYVSLCCLVGHAANQKGRNGNYCALASLLLSPVMMFLYLMTVPALTPRKADSAERIKTRVAGAMFVVICTISIVILGQISINAINWEHWQTRLDKYNYQVDHHLPIDVGP